MHAGVVEDVIQWSVMKTDVGVVPVSYGNGKVENDIGLMGCESSQKHHSQVLHGRVENIFHPMEAQVCCKAHLFHRMMHLVKFPQNIETM
jgi:hypothetical protein